MANFLSILSLLVTIFTRKIYVQSKQKEETKTNSMKPNF